MPEEYFLFPWSTIFFLSISYDVAAKLSWLEWRAVNGCWTGSVGCQAGKEPLFCTWLQWLLGSFTNIKELRKCTKNGLGCLDMEQRHAVSGTPEKGSPFPLLAEGKVLNHTDFFFSEPEKNGCHYSWEQCKTGVKNNSNGMGAETPSCALGDVDLHWEDEPCPEQPLGTPWPGQGCTNCCLHGRNNENKSHFHPSSGSPCWGRRCIQTLPRWNWKFPAPRGREGFVHAPFHPKTRLFFVSIKKPQLIYSFQLSWDMNCTLKILNPFSGSLTQTISSPWLALSERMECLAPISSNNELSCAQISEPVISMRK